MAIEFSAGRCCWTPCTICILIQNIRCNSLIRARVYFAYVMD